MQISRIEGVVFYAAALLSVGVLEIHAFYRGYSRMLAIPDEVSIVLPIFVGALGTTGLALVYGYSLFSIYSRVRWMLRRHPQYEQASRAVLTTHSPDGMTSMCGSYADLERWQLGQIGLRNHPWMHFFRWSAVLAPLGISLSI